MRITTWLLLIPLILVTPAEARDCGARQGKDPTKTALLVSQCHGWEFLKEAQLVQAREPELYRNPQFQDFQAFTLDNQRYIARNQNELRRLYVVPPQAVRREVFAASYIKMAARYTGVLRALPEFLALHRSMFTDPEHDRQYMADYQQAFRDLAYDPSRERQAYRPLACDYMAQPVDALWFSWNAARLMDEYGDRIWGPAWRQERDRLLAEGDLMSPEQARAEFPQDRPYEPVPQFRRPQLAPVEPSFEGLDGGVLGLP